MLRKTLRVGMGQMLVEGGKLDENLVRALAMIRDAAQQECEVVVLPECLDVGWTHPSAHELAQPIPGRTSDVLSGAAAQSGIHVVAGVTERAGAKIFNSALLMAPSGEILLKHRKINVLDIAQDLYAIGDRLSVAETSIGTVAVDICADNFPDSLALGHALARMGAGILLSPCAWAVETDFDHQKTPYGADLWRPAYTTLARLYEMPVIGVSNVGPVSDGPWKGRLCIGCSLAVDNDGQIVGEGPFGADRECLVPVEVHLTPRVVTGTDIAEMLRSKAYTGLQSNTDSG
jgi:predicted amidohydrolase